MSNTKEKSATAAPKMKVQKFTQSLKVTLTTEEIADRADRAAQMIGNRDEKEEEQKAATKHAKSIIESMDAEIRRLSNEVKTKSHYPAVECERRYDYSNGRYQEIRLDTFDVIADRKLTPGECQSELSFDENAE